MSSQRKINSARTNGAKSHGPKTKEGLKKSSMNAVTHGLYSLSVVLKGESREQFQEMLDVYIRQFQPDGQAEFDLVEEMVAAKWRERRLWAIEADLLEDEVIVQQQQLDRNGDTYSQITPLSFAYRELAKSSLPFLNRHESRLERAYSRSLKTLLELQRIRQKAAIAGQQDLQERTQSQIATPPPTPAPSRVSTSPPSTAGPTPETEVSVTPSERRSLTKDAIPTDTNPSLRERPALPQ
jgi:hypothetical protein